MHDLLSEDKVKDILFKLTMLGFEEEYDEKEDSVKSYLKGRRDPFKDVLACYSGTKREKNILLQCDMSTY